MTAEERKQAEETAGEPAGEILEKHLADLIKAGIKTPLRYGVIYNRIIDAMEAYASLKVREALIKYSFDTENEKAKDNRG